jgi:hypothetical protein
VGVVYLCEPRWRVCDPAKGRPGSCAEEVSCTPLDDLEIGLFRLVFGP